MAPALTLTLLARTTFRRGDVGWTTPEGVVRLGESMGGFEDLPSGSSPVRAMEAIRAGQPGRFVTIDVGEGLRGRGRPMVQAIETTLFAKVSFQPGQEGWLTTDGVMDTPPPGQSEAANEMVRVRALEVVCAESYGRFIEVLPSSSDDVTGPAGRADR